MCFTKEIWTYIFWWLITFEPLEQKQSYVPLLKVLMCGMNSWEAQLHGGIFILQYTSLKMVLLLHKTALVNFPMATTVHWHENDMHWLEISISFQGLDMMHLPITLPRSSMWRLSWLSTGLPCLTFLGLYQSYEN